MGVTEAIDVVYETVVVGVVMIVVAGENVDVDVDVVVTEIKLVVLKFRS